MRTFSNFRSTRRLIRRHPRALLGVAPASAYRVVPFSCSYVVLVSMVLSAAACSGPLPTFGNGRFQLVHANLGALPMVTASLRAPNGERATLEIGPVDFSVQNEVGCRRFELVLRVHRRVSRPWPKDVEVVVRAAAGSFELVKRAQTLTGHLNELRALAPHESIIALTKEGAQVQVGERGFKVGASVRRAVATLIEHAACDG